MSFEWNLKLRDTVQLYVYECTNRPDYQKLSELRKRYPGIPMMALTATASPRVRQDILVQLQMKQPKWFLQSFNRTNLRYEIVQNRE